MSFDTQAPDQSAAPTMDPAKNTQPADQQTQVFQIGDRSYNNAEVVNKIQNADSHIATLESENAANKALIAELQSKAESSSKVDDLLEKLSQGKKEEQTAPASTPDLNVKDIVAQVKSEFTEESNAIKQSANMTKSMAAAEEKLGEGYAKLVMSKASELGMSGSEVDSMAKKNPSAFAKLFLDIETKHAPGVNESTVNTLVHQGNKEENLHSNGFMKMRTIQGKAGEVQRRMKFLEEQEKRNL